MRNGIWVEVESVKPISRRILRVPWKDVIDGMYLGPDRLESAMESIPAVRVEVVDVPADYMKLRLGPTSLKAAEGLSDNAEVEIDIPLRGLRR